MSEMNRTQAGRDRVRVFYNIIDEYDDLIPISCRMNLAIFDGHTNDYLHSVCSGIGPPI